MTDTNLLAEGRFIDKGRETVPVRSLDELKQAEPGIRLRAKIERSERRYQEAEETIIFEGYDEESNFPFDFFNVPIIVLNADEFKFFIPFNGV